MNVTATVVLGIVCTIERLTVPTQLNVVIYCEGLFIWCLFYVGHIASVTLAVYETWE